MSKMVTESSDAPKLIEEDTQPKPASMGIIAWYFDLFYFGVKSWFSRYSWAVQNITVLTVILSLISVMVWHTGTPFDSQSLRLSHTSTSVASGSSSDTTLVGNLTAASYAMAMLPQFPIPYAGVHALGDIACFELVQNETWLQNTCEDLRKFERHLGDMNLKLYNVSAQLDVTLNLVHDAVNLTFGLLASPNPNGLVWARRHYAALAETSNEMLLSTIIELEQLRFMVTVAAAVKKSLVDKIDRLQMRLDGNFHPSMLGLRSRLGYWLLVQTGLSDDLNMFGGLPQNFPEVPTAWKRLEPSFDSLRDADWAITHAWHAAAFMTNAWQRDTTPLGKGKGGLSEWWIVHGGKERLEEWADMAKYIIRFVREGF